jgi:signal transduction histidine kinase
VLPLKPFSEETNLRQLIDNLLLSLETAENVTVISDVADDMQKVKVDPSYLKRILTNLLMNAEQAMPNGGKITITAAKKKATALSPYRILAKAYLKTSNPISSLRCSQPNQRVKASD